MAKRATKIDTSSKLGGLMNKLVKTNAKNVKSSLLTDYFDNPPDTVSTDIPAINIILSGDYDGGFLGAGLVMVAAPSKHFKSCIVLSCAKGFLDKYDDGVVLFYDSEFGTNEKYFNNMDIDVSRVVHTPVTNIEELRNDLVQKMNEIDDNDNVMIMIDSIGNLPSTKSIKDAESDNSKVDMTRAKDITSLLQIAMVKSNAKRVPIVAINKTYDTQEMFSKEVQAGGKAATYTPNEVIFVGRQTIKDASTIEGFRFILKSHKSRTIREGSNIPLIVTFDGGIEKYSGLLELALAMGIVFKPKNGYYSRTHIEGDKQWTEKRTYSDEFWNPILTETDFKQRIKDMFTLSNRKLIDFDKQDLGEVSGESQLNNDVEYNEE